MPNGSCVASHDFFGASTLNETVQTFVDHSGACAGPGAKWRYAGNVSGLYWANLFAPPGERSLSALYMMGVSGADGATDRAIVITRSTDYGESWTRPSVLFPAGPGGRSYHCAPTPTLIATDGRLYRGFEVDGTRGALLARTRLAGAAAKPGGLLDRTAWELAVPLNWSAAVLPPSWTGRFGWQEGNAVEGLDGTVYDILRIDGQTNKTYNKAVVLRLEQPHDGLPTGAGAGRMVFDRIIDFPSCSSKFVIRRDPGGIGAPAGKTAPESGAERKYYTLSTDVTPTAVTQNTVYARNHLVLATSPDLFNWTTCATVLADDTGFDAVDSARFTGFHYVDWVFDGDDIVAAIRTGYRGSNTYHNANRMTTIRINGFRARCQQSHSPMSEFTRVGPGWCRPTTGYVPGGSGLTDGDCAAACLQWDRCHGFANSVGSGGYCALYPEAPASAGNISPGLYCYTRK